jgi:hypothetical protein
MFVGLGDSVAGRLSSHGSEDFRERRQAMILCRPLRARLLVVLAVGWLALPAARVMGQLTPDPYNIVGEYNGQYAPFMYAIEPAPGGMFPNQARLQERAGYRSANRFQNYVESLDGSLPESDLPNLGRRSGAGTPYYRANRQYDRDFGRIYQPNEVADKSFYTDQDSRNSRYFEAMRERDPRKRAQLLREYNMENLRSARSLSTVRNAPGRESSRVAPRSPSLPDSDPLPEPRAPLSGGSARGRSTLAPPGSLRSGTRSGLDSRRALARPRSLTAPLRGGLGDDLDTAPSRRLPSDILERSDRLDRGTRPVAPRLPADPDVAPPPPPVR